jgi:hypothetical protein
LTTALAVTNFLPSNGNSQRLPTGLMNNPTTYANTLAGELVALKLSVRFDELNSAFSPSTTLLKNMVIASGTFAGWTVQQLIDAADAKIGNCGGNYGRTTLATAVAAVNTGYAGGTTNSGYLQCPSAAAMMVQAVESLPPTVMVDGMDEEKMKVIIFPNPVRSTANIQVEGTSGDQPTTLDILSLSGTLVEQRHLGVLAEGVSHRIQWQVEGMNAGVYLYRFVSGDRIATGRIIVE